MAIELNVISSDIAHLKELCDALENDAFKIIPHYSFAQFMADFNRYNNSYIVMVPENETSPQIAELLGLAICAISFTDVFFVFAQSGSRTFGQANQRENIIYSNNPNEISATILRRQLNDNYNSPAKTVIDEQVLASAIPRPQNITNREHEVALRICQGLSNKHIARELEISHRTVEVHRARVMQKIGARNVADFAVKYMWNKPKARESIG